MAARDAGEFSWVFSQKNHIDDMANWKLDCISDETTYQGIGAGRIHMSWFAPSLYMVDRRILNRLDKSLYQFTGCPGMR